MNSISFTLLCFDKPLSFDLDVFSSLIELKASENCVSIPPKETMKAGLATLGLFDEKHPNLSSTDSIRLWPELSPDPIKSLLPPSGEVNADDTTDKIDSSSTPSPHTSQMSAGVCVHCCSNKCLDASELAEEQGNQPNTVDVEKGTRHNLFVGRESRMGYTFMGEVTFEQLMDEVITKIKFVQLEKEYKPKSHQDEAWQVCQSEGTQWDDMNFLLEVVEVFKKANTEGEKWEKNNLEIPTQEANAQIPDPAQGEKQTEDDHMVDT
ncbi:hypothetical protein Tco_0810109 [Tanacetum coccineum]